MPNNDDVHAMLDAIRDNLSPEAVALVIAKLQPVYATGEQGKQAEKEVTWFADRLLSILGRWQYETHCEELGL